MTQIVTEPGVFEKHISQLANTHGVLVEGSQRRLGDRYISAHNWSFK